MLAGSNLTGFRLDQGLVVVQILLRHSPGGKPFLEMPADLPPIEFGKSSERFNSRCFPRDDKAGYAVVNDLRHGPGLEGDDGRPAGHGLDHDETERLWPIDRKQ